MDSSVETRTEQAKEFSSASIRGPIVLRHRDERLAVDSDGSVAHLESVSERRLLFGRDALNLFKVQAGIKVRAQRPEWRFAITPRAITFSGRVLGALDITQTIGFLEGTLGMSRRALLRNAGTSALRVRLISLHDPTSANFRAEGDPWGSIGLNAFNRTGHVAMDEFADPPSARVIGSYPGPKSIFMSTDRAKVGDVLQSGEFPDPTTGLSGQVVLLLMHEFDLAPQESRSVNTVSVFNPSKLEEALSEFDRAAGPPAQALAKRPASACSNPIVASALGWARAGLEGAEFEVDLLERLESLPGLTYANPEAARRLIEGTKQLVRRDGSLPHSRASTEPGYLESALYAAYASEFGLLTGDKKLAKSLYSTLRKTATFLAGSAERDVLIAGPTAPQGWRRRLGRGFPSGEVAEVTLSVIAGLAAFSSLARIAGKSEDSARFREKAELMANSLGRRLVDESGYLALNVDSRGAVQKAETIDQAVGSYRYSLGRGVSSGIVHRLLDKDFETGFGPRTVPTSNRIFFNSSYGDGQLGGYWTRAALAHIILSYATDYAGIGSLGLQKVSKLVTEDVVGFGGVPGSFPRWIDLERRESKGRGSDQVSASRFVESVVRGELGLSRDKEGIRIDPPLSSNLAWLMVDGIWLGEQATVFVGRSAQGRFVLAKSSKVRVEGGESLSGYEPLSETDAAPFVATFYGPGQYVCAGNSSVRPVHTNVSFQPRDPGLLKHLSGHLEELDQRNLTWQRSASIRVSPKMTMELSLGPGEWKVFRVSTN